MKVQAKKLLISVLVVLSIILLLSAFCYGYFKSNDAEQRVDQFMDQVKQSETVLQIYSD